MINKKTQYRENAADCQYNKYNNITYWVRETSIARRDRNEAYVILAITYTFLIAILVIGLITD